VETIDSEGNVGWYSSIALDSDDRPHISYYDQTNGDLKYAYRAGESWEIETIDNEADVGLHTSIALDSDDRPHISYYDQTNGDLKYATMEVAGETRGILRLIAAIVAIPAGLTILLLIKSHSRA
jgi:hypothetical protein